MPETLPLAEGRLSDRLADQYWDDGFLFPIQVMPAEEAIGLRVELEAQWQNGGLPQSLNTYKRVICIASCQCHAGSLLTRTFYMSSRAFSGPTS